MKALVVDDNREVAEFVAEALFEVDQLETDVALTVEEAEGLIAKTRYDILIVDVYLRGGDSEPDGLRLLRRLKEANPEQKAILVTGKSFSRILTEVVFRAGTVDLLAKPVDLKVLLQTVRKLLGKTKEGH